MSYASDERRFHDRTIINFGGELYCREAPFHMLCPACLGVTEAAVTMDQFVFFEHEKPVLPGERFCEVALVDMPDPVREPHYYNLRRDPE